MTQSRRPKCSPRRKLFRTERTLILRLRRERNLGARRIQSELWLHWEIDLSVTAIHKVLRQAEVKPLVKPRRVTHPKRYSRPLPGDRIQMDTMKIATGVYQYTAIDYCSRFRVLAQISKRLARG